MVWTAMREERAKRREERAKRREERQSTGGHSKGYQGPRGAELERIRAAQRSPRPDRPCIRCGNAGYCEHRPAP